MTFYQQYIEELNRLKLLSEGRVISVIPEVEKFAYKALTDWIDRSLDTQGGRFVASQQTIDILNEFDSGYLRILNQMKLYKGAVSSFVKDLPAMASLMEKYQVSANGIEWPSAVISSSEKLVVNEVIKAYTDNGLNTGFVQPLRDLLYQNIASGTNVQDAKAYLKSYIISGKDQTGKLKKHLTATSQMAVDGYTGMINKKLMETFDYPYLIMSGSLINTSSPQCRLAVRQYNSLFTEKEWAEDIEPIAKKNGLIKGTTFKNLPFNKLHYACRHDFTPAMLKPGDKIGENEILK